MRRSVFVVLATVVLLVNASTVVRWSFDLCAADVTGCAPRFGLVGASSDETRFTEMSAMWHQRRADGGVLTSSLLTECAAAYGDVNSIGDECLPMAQIWLAMLRSSHVCDDNHQWVIGHGCVCIEGHHCEVDCTEAALSDLWSFTMAAGIIGIGALVAFSRQTWQDQQLAAADEERFQRAAVAYYTLNAQLWLEQQAALLPAAVISRGAHGTPVFHL